MDLQTLLNIILAALVILLTILILSRSRSDSRHRRTHPQPSDTDLAGILAASAIDGSIARVAGRVSDVLKGPLGCARIVFLRKQRGQLELNFYHGLGTVRKHQFRLRYSDSLSEFLRQGYRPRSLSELRPHVPDEYYQQLEQLGLTLFLPVFCRDNLYGVYFLADLLGGDTDNKEHLAVLAYTLASAYHTRWHEARFERLQQRLEKKTSGTESRPALPSDLPRRVLTLVRHRRSETLVPKLIDSIQDELGVNRLAYLYEPREDNEPLTLHSKGRIQIPTPPDRATFLAVLGSLKPHGSVDLQSLKDLSAEGQIWVTQLYEAGVRQLSRFEVLSGRHGLLLLWRSIPDSNLAEHLDRLQPVITELVRNAEMHEKYEELSYTDSLTGLANQRYFRKRLDEEINRARRYERSLALIIFDLDGLKQVNDRHGHLAGDEILTQMGRILKNCIRTIDIVSRYGGDEFCVIMPEADMATCRQFMQRLQQTIGEGRFAIENVGEPLQCTISQGAAIFPDHADNQTDLIFNADMALLKAKAGGRNSFLIHNETVGTETP